jgi:hypothetical protein
MMQVLSAAPATVTPQIPFWLQIVSIAVAPILGFLGVAIGVFLTERNRRAAYILEEKKHAYLEFINMLSNVNSFWSNKFPSAARTATSGGTDDILGFSKAHVEELHRTFLQIRLFGSGPVVESAMEAFHYLALASVTGIQMLDKGFSSAKWNQTVVKAGIVVMSDFSAAARKDLGLRKLGPKTAESASSSASADLLKTVSDIQQQPHAGDPPPPEP